MKNRTVYELNLGKNDGHPSVQLPLLQATEIMTVLGHALKNGINAKIDHTPQADFLYFELDYCLDTTLESKPWLFTKVYNSRTRGTKENNELPFPLKGKDVVALCESVADVAKDFDDYLSFDIFFLEEETGVAYKVVYGKVNSSLTDSYTPLAGAYKSLTLK
jgi:hypothetical protein